MVSFFISYRRGDSAGHTGRLNDALEQRFGADAFFRDIEDIAPGTDFTEVLDQALETSQAVLVVIGPTWVTAADADGLRLFHEGDFVRSEVAAALGRPGVRVIPVLVNGATMPTEEQLPDDLKSLTTKQAIEVSDTRWAYDVGRLGDLLAGNLGLPSHQPSSDTTTHRRRPSLVIGGAVAGVVAVILVVLLSSGPDDSSSDSSATGTSTSATAGTLASVDAPPATEPPSELVAATAPTTPAPTTPAPTTPASVPTFVVGDLNWVTSTDPPGAVDWPTASEYCEAIVVDGENFRLPTIDELRSISDPGNPDPFGRQVLAIFQDGLGSNWVWSSEHDAGSAEFFDFDSLTVETAALNNVVGTRALCVSG